MMGKTTNESSKILPRILKILPYFVLLLFFLIVPGTIGKLSWYTIFIFILCKMIATSGLRTITLAGDMSFAMGAFMGLGAYAVAIMIMKWNFPAWLAVILAAVFTCIIAVVTGIPFARLKNTYYCMTTMFLGVFLIYVFQSFEWTGGNNGIKQIPKLFSVNKDNIGTVYFFFVALAVVCIFLMWRFEYSRIGNTLKAISQSHEVAASMGVNERFYRLMAIGVAAFFCGIAGACYCLFNGQVVGSTYGMTLDLWIIMFFMVGGKNSFFGPLLGATILGIVNDGSKVILGTFSPYAPYIACVVLLIAAYALPDGLASIPATIKAAITRKKSDKKEA